MYKKQSSQVDLLVVLELDLDLLEAAISQQESLYAALCRGLDPEDLVNTLPELNPHEDLLQILYTKRNAIAEKIHELIQNN